MPAKRFGMKNTKHIHLYGHVQGVFFRESMCRKAVELGVTGWVRNRSDGSIEAVIQGQDKPIEAFIAWARRGPEQAHVERMEIVDTFGDYKDFRRVETL